MGFAQLFLQAPHANADTVAHLPSALIICYTYDCPSFTMDKWMWLTLALDIVDEHDIALSSTPSNSQTLSPSLRPSFSSYKTRPVLKPLHESDHFVLWVWGERHSKKKRIGILCVSKGENTTNFVSCPKLFIMVALHNSLISNNITLSVMLIITFSNTNKVTQMPPIHWYTPVIFKKTKTTQKVIMPHELSCWFLSIHTNNQIHFTTFIFLSWQILFKYSITLKHFIYYKGTYELCFTQNMKSWKQMNTEEMTSTQHQIIETLLSTNTQSYVFVLWPRLCWL